MTLLLRACGVQDILLSAEGIPTGTDPNKPVSSLVRKTPLGGTVYSHRNDLGIIRSQEYPDGFEPDTPITRMEICAMAVRALGLEDEASDTAAAELGFADSEDIPATYRGCVSAVEWDVLRGYPDNTFQPGNYATRAKRRLSTGSWTTLTRVVGDPGRVPRVHLPASPVGWIRNDFLQDSGDPCNAWHWLSGSRYGPQPASPPCQSSCNAWYSSNVQRCDCRQPVHSGSHLVTGILQASQGMVYHQPI